MIRLFRRYLRGWVTRSRGDCAEGDVKAKSRAPECPRCGVTARAMAFTRHQWIASGIDWE